MKSFFAALSFFYLTPVLEKCSMTCSHKTLCQFYYVSIVGLLLGMDLKLSKYSIVYPQPVYRQRRTTDRFPAVDKAPQLSL